MLLSVVHIAVLTIWFRAPILQHIDKHNGWLSLNSMPHGLSNKSCPCFSCDNENGVNGFTRCNVTRQCWLRMSDVWSEHLHFIHCAAHCRKQNAQPHGNWFCRLLRCCLLVNRTFGRLCGLTPNSTTIQRNSQKQFSLLHLCARLVQKMSWDMSSVPTSVASVLLRVLSFCLRDPLRMQLRPRVMALVVWLLKLGWTAKAVSTNQWMRLSRSAERMPSWLGSLTRVHSVATVSWMSGRARLQRKRAFATKVWKILASFGGSLGEVLVAWRTVGAGVGAESSGVNWMGKSLSMDSM